MRQRVLSGLIMAPMLLLIFFGGPLLLAGAFVVSFMAAGEYSKAFREKRIMSAEMKASIVFLYALAALHYPLGISGSQNFFLVELMPLWLALTLFVVFLKSFNMKKFGTEQAALTVMGTLYTGFLAVHIVLVDQRFSGEPLFSYPQAGSPWFTVGGFDSYVWIVVLAAFGCDIFAYFTGMAIGRHKLCPGISPKKTVEGSIGGIVGSIAVCGVYGYFLIEGGFVTSLVLGALCGVTAQFGDLTASVMKRSLGIKDWGTLIPGHGGILDRFDSVLFTAPTVYYSLLIMGVNR
ncbi:MAG: phosphatidate cytidylyltransferase [Clostridiales Family XIII bacterium]|jgi:phosphatidate cytidylyltransferase|nr:phosphatidate cytidylyltransferase [Clostridiales Family XIII bacterium]